MLIEIGRSSPYQPIHRNAAGQPDYAIPLTLECRQEAENLWSGLCPETGTVAVAASANAVQAELESNVLLQLSELEALSDLPAHLEQWGIVPIPLAAAAADPAGKLIPAGKGTIEAPAKKPSRE